MPWTVDSQRQRRAFRAKTHRTHGRFSRSQATGIVKETEKKFWSTKDPGQSPFTYKAGVNKVIRGWDSGLLGTKVGETIKLDIPADEGAPFSESHKRAPGLSLSLSLSLHSHRARGLVWLSQAARAQVTPFVNRAGYGADGFPAWGIPPNGGLYFEIEVLSIEGKEL